MALPLTAGPGMRKGAEVRVVVGEVMVDLNWIYWINLEVNGRAMKYGQILLTKSQDRKAGMIFSSGAGSSPFFVSTQIQVYQDQLRCGWKGTILEGGFFRQPAILTPDLGICNPANPLQPSAGHHSKHRWST